MSNLRKKEKAGLIADPSAEADGNVILLILLSATADQIVVDTLIHLSKQGCLPINMLESKMVCYSKKLSMIPAATAEPITPDTLGAMACMSR